MNSDFTTKKWPARMDFLYDYSKPFEEHNVFKFYHENEFGETVARWVRMNKVSENDPLRIQAKKDYEEMQA